jgi:hypothetical protein
MRLRHEFRNRIDSGDEEQMSLFCLSGETATMQRRRAQADGLYAFLNWFEAPLLWRPEGRS